MSSFFSIEMLPSVHVLKLHMKAFLVNTFWLHGLNSSLVNC